MLIIDLIFPDQNRKPNVGELNPMYFGSHCNPWYWKFPENHLFNSDIMIMIFIIVYPNFFFFINYTLISVFKDCYLTQR